jgi:hypothetical protein
MGAPFAHIFSLSLLIKVEGFFVLEIMATSSNHGSSSTKDNFNTYGSNSSSSSSSSDNGMHEMLQP